MTLAAIEAPAEAKLSRLSRLAERIAIERLAYALIAMGIALRLAAPFFMELRSDGETYAVMARAFLAHGDFLMPWGEVTTWHRTGPEYSYHYPPLYPILLAGFYAVLGFGAWQTQTAAVLISIAAIGVVYGTSRDLFGARVAALTAAFVAVEPHLIWVTGTGFSENLVVALFTLTLWAILKSLQDERYVLLAGLFAGLAYLTRASMGPFFLVAGVGGFLWRFAYMRWRVFKSLPYMGAIAIFATFVLGWAARNLYRHGWPRWETSWYTTYVTRYAFEHSEKFIAGIGWKTLFLGAMLLAPLVVFAPEAWRALKDGRREATSALWLSIFLVYALGILFTAMFWTYEPTSRFWWDNHRYALVADVPLVWLLVTRERAASTFSLRAAGILLALLALSAFAFFTPVQFPEVAAAEALNPHLDAGDEIAVDGTTIKYAFYAYLARHDVEAYGWTCNVPDPSCDDPDYIVSLLTGARYDGYERMSEHTVRYWNGHSRTATVWRLATP